MTEKELLEYVRGEILFNINVWFDGERYHPFGDKQKLYKHIYDFREKFFAEMKEIKE